MSSLGDLKCLTKALGFYSLGIASFVVCLFVFKSDGNKLNVLY